MTHPTINGSGKSIQLADGLTDGEKLDQILSQGAEILARLESGRPAWLGVKAAAIYSDSSESSIRKLVRLKKLTARRPVGGKVLVSRKELDRLISESTTRPRNGRGSKGSREGRRKKKAAAQASGPKTSPDRPEANRKTRSR